MNESEILKALSITSMDEAVDAVSEVEAPKGKRLEALLALVGAEDDILVSTVAERLGEAEREGRVVEALLQMASHISPLVREEAIQSLASLGVQEASDLAAFMLANDPDETVRAGAAEAWGRLGDASMLPALEKGMQDPSSMVRAYVAMAIGAIGDESAQGFLREQMKENEAAEVVIEIVGALWRLGDDTAWDGLADLLKSADKSLLPNVFNLLEDLLVALKGRAFSPDHIALFTKELYRIQITDPVNGPHARLLLARMNAR